MNEQYNICLETLNDKFFNADISIVKQIVIKLFSNHLQFCKEFLNISSSDAFNKWT